MLRFGLWALLLLPPLLAGCAPAFQDTLREQAGPERVFIDSVPFYPQEKYQCGPASLAMLLAWSGQEISPLELTPQVYSPELEGSLQPAIVAAARRQGRVAYPIAGHDQLLAELKAGHPVLVLQNLGLAWFPRWHYAVVLGYHRDEGLVYLHSGRQRAQELSARVFARTWDRAGSWGLLVLPPERLPATARERPWTSAVVGLERAGQWSAAIRAYEAAIERWPDSVVAWMGLGNGRYALKDYGGAQQAFEQVLARKPDFAPAVNNLARSLAAAGRYEEALAVIDRIPEKGGPWQEDLQRTREEILREGSGPGAGAD